MQVRFDFGQSLQNTLLHSPSSTRHPRCLRTFASSTRHASHASFSLAPYSPITPDFTHPPLNHILSPLSPHPIAPAPLHSFPSSVLTAELLVLRDEIKPDGTMGKRVSTGDQSTTTIENATW